MKFGIYISNFGDYALPQRIAELAYAAEVNGWDGFFIWDHIQWTLPISAPAVDPGIALAAIALRTQRIQFGAFMTPLPRRRPWKVARETVSLDQLSNGRLIFGAAIGGDWCREYSAFGEDPDAKRHGEMLDESLEILTGLWQGEPFHYSGRHYQINAVQFTPVPVQQPRIPIVLAGVWPGRVPFIRAARWDGIFPLGRSRALTPQDYADLRAFIASLRPSMDGFEVFCEGRTDGHDEVKETATVQAFAHAGVTWWLEHAEEGRDSYDDMRHRIRLGPPRT